MSDNDALTVFYDGACPLCRREIAFYRRRKGADAVNWVDLTVAEDGNVAPGLSRECALRRLHVRDARGRHVSGAAAFAKLWESLPAFRLLGRVIQIPPMSWLAEWGYRVFLKVRPGLLTLIRW
jgi:predicted DCC family thiol-disulfide oxidoreductase YuxK